MSPEVQYSHARPIHAWSTLRTELVWAYQGAVSKDDRQNAVDHSYGYWLWHVQEGSVEITTSGTALAAKSGEWLLCPSGKSGQNFSKDAIIQSFHFLCHWPTGQNLFPNERGVVFLARKYHDFNVRARQLQHYVQERFPGMRVDLFEEVAELPIFLEAQALFYRLLLELTEVLRAEGLHPTDAVNINHRVELAVRLLEASPLEQPFPLPRILREVGLSRVHLDRLMSNQLHVTSKEYWENLREEVASQQLESTDLSIKEIGYNLGFKQPSHFTTWFKKRKKIPPLKFRRQTRERLIG